MSIMEHDLDELRSFDAAPIVPGALVYFLARARRQLDCDETLGTVLSIIKEPDSDELTTCTVLWSVDPPSWATSRRVTEARTKKSITDALRNACSTLTYANSSKHSALEAQFGSVISKLMKQFVQQGLITEHHESVGIDPMFLETVIDVTYKLYHYQQSFTRVQLRFQV